MEDIWLKLQNKVKEPPKAHLVQTSNAGRGLVASQDLQKGQVILMEKPLIVGPPQSVGPHFCINCSQPLTVGVLQGNIFRLDKYLPSRYIPGINFTIVIIHHILKAKIHFWPQFCWDSSWH